MDGRTPPQEVGSFHQGRQAEVACYLEHISVTTYQIAPQRT